MTRKAAPKAKQETFKHIFGKRRTVVKLPSNWVTGSRHGCTKTRDSGSVTPGKGMRPQWSSNWGTSGGLTRSGCKSIPRVIHTQPPCSCFALCIVHVPFREHIMKHNRRRKRPTSKKPFVYSYVFIAASRNPTCACPSWAHVQPETHCACTCPVRHVRCFRWLLLRYVQKYSYYTPWPFSLSVLSNLHSLPPSQAHARWEG